ncbi:MAG: tRNA uridine-5-carboxymethylaminomethyl(34) synthesis GTPase MnmE, partial [Muribaculaceae bacterium]|nr:tRNA uridine-5-carboxymethylaminomethyl(34) synthesis GTPase MnmE [Muribaculaceae bacterium]
MTDTIAAIATPLVPSAIGIIRLSGPESIAVLDRVFAPAHGAPMSQRAERMLVYGALHDGEGRVIDHCLATLSRAPRSYTGEDTAELQCHGSPTALTMGLEAIFAAGARQARAGEFTRRAFLSGKLDLT